MDRKIDPAGRVSWRHLKVASATVYANAAPDVADVRPVANPGLDAGMHHDGRRLARGSGGLRLVRFQPGFEVGEGIVGRGR